MPTRTPWSPSAVAGEVVSATDVKTIPGGWTGYAEVTAPQTLTGTATETDLTGLTLTYTVPANRRLKVTVQGLLSRTVADGVTVGRIRVDGTEVNRWAQHSPSAATEFDNAVGHAIITPSAGSHTFKATLQRFSGTGNVTLNAASTNPAFILVEDLGPAS